MKELTSSPSVKCKLVNGANRHDSVSPANHIGI